MAKVVRKKYIVKKELQLKLFLQLVIFMFFVALLVGLTEYFTIYGTLMDSFSGEKVTLLRNLVFQQLILRFLPAVFAIVIISVFITHKIAGPIFVFQRAIKQMSEGQEVRTIRLRKHDKLNDFAEDLNKLIDRINTEKSINA